MIEEPTYVLGDIRQFIGTGQPGGGILISIDLGQEIIAGSQDGDKLVEDAAVATTYEIDYAEAAVWDLIMTADTTFSEINLPNSGYSKTITIRLQGDFLPSFPANWGIDGQYVAQSVNNIVVQYIKSGVYNTKLTS